MKKEYKTFQGYVTHFLNVLTEEEKESVSSGVDRIEKLYAMAIRKAKPYKGTRFHTLNFGGGIIFPFCCWENACNNLPKKSEKPA